MLLTRPRHAEQLPVSIDRRRVYVLPTRFGLFFSVLLLAMVVGALNYNNNPALMLGFLLGGAGMASLLAAQMQLTGLEIAAIDAEPVPAGQPLMVRVHTRAEPSRRRRGLRVDDDGAGGGGVPAGESALLNLDQGHGEAQLALPTRRRGWLELPRLRVYTLRPLGLARAWAYIWSDAPLLVYPTPEEHGPPLPTGSGENVQTRLHASGDDVHHLRAYRTGDSRRAIAWKPSARRDSLIVREYEQPLGADVVLDWNALSGLAWEPRVSRLARWVDEAERDGRRYRLCLPGQAHLGPDRGVQHRHACLRALALLPDATEATEATDPREIA
ncbi:DUF58 domain-containing protein [Agrilutibacter solisilvae]|uniref:DUF58 domain-containing protein n=1 Tax=Agrilutibacter solisilvae TaxID=2763317 RepID=A0A975ATK1_9GAMM|nr:DUF58 domain-containing protein [Lysobacter solisilvae]QSX80119.1 DUF58 domain-containing protein [Lysobacter solisilvae]